MCPESSLDGWTVRKASLSGDDEQFDHKSRMVLIDTSRHGERWMRDHVEGHIFLGHILQGRRCRFTDEQEAAADAYARGRRVSYIPWDDDDATVPMAVLTPSELESGSP